MQILLQKFTVVHNGVAYTAGSVMDIPENDAKILLDEGVAIEVNQETTTAQVNAPKTEDYNSMSVAELKEYCKQNAVDLGKAKRKADILAVIEENLDSLPAIDFGKVVK